MSNSFTLDDIRAAAEAKYGATEIAVDGTTVRLLNPIRLPKHKRDSLVEVQKRLDNEDSDESQEDVIRDAIRIVAESRAQAERLIDAVGDDLGVLAEVFASYSAKESVGEA